VVVTTTKELQSATAREMLAEGLDVPATARKQLSLLQRNWRSSKMLVAVTETTMAKTEKNVNSMLTSA